MRWKAVYKSFGMCPSRRWGSCFDGRDSEMTTAGEGTSRNNSLHMSTRTANPTKPRADMDRQQARGIYRIKIIPCLTRGTCKNKRTKLEKKIGHIKHSCCRWTNLAAATRGHLRPWCHPSLTPTRFLSLREPWLSLASHL